MAIVYTTKAYHDLRDKVKTRRSTRPSCFSASFEVQTRLLSSIPQRIRVRHGFTYPHAVQHTHHSHAPLTRSSYSLAWNYAMRIFVTGNLWNYCSVIVMRLTFSSGRRLQHHFLPSALLMSCTHVRQSLQQALHSKTRVRSCHCLISDFTATLFPASFTSEGRVSGTQYVCLVRFTVLHQQGFAYIVLHPLQHP